MTIHYDETIDQLAIVLADRPGTTSDEIAPGVVVDFDVDGKVVGIEIEHASRSVDLSNLKTLETVR